MNEITPKRYMTPGNHNLPVSTEYQLHKSYSGNITLCLFDTERCPSGFHINAVENALKFDKRIMGVLGEEYEKNN